MSLDERKLSLDDVMENLKADIRELYDRMSKETACLTIAALNAMEFEDRVRRSARYANSEHD